VTSVHVQTSPSPVDEQDECKDRNIYSYSEYTSSDK